MTIEFSIGNDANLEMDNGRGYFYTSTLLVVTDHHLCARSIVHLCEIFARSLCYY